MIAAGLSSLVGGNHTFAPALLVAPLVASSFNLQGLRVLLSICYDRSLRLLGTLRSQAASGQLAVCA